jgi:sec-independent protein translocase protein TatC
MGLLSFIFKRREEESSEEMSFVDHLEALRGVLFRSLIGIVGGAIVVGIYFDFFFKKVIKGPTQKGFATFEWMCALGEKLKIKALCTNPIDVKWQNTSINGQFNLYFQIIFMGGVIIAFPWILYQIWSFVKPALSNKEKGKTTGIIFWVSLLFFIGIFFGYFILAPYSITFMAGFQLDSTIENIWTVDSYLETFTSLILGTGLAFQLPLAIYFLAKMGLVTKSFLLKYSRYAILAILVLAAVITPPDVISQLIVSVPLILLFYVGIILAGKEEKRRSEKDAKEWS